jgi:uncharacterized protein YdeI (BOF family)
MRKLLLLGLLSAALTAPMALYAQATATPTPAGDNSMGGSMGGNMQTMGSSADATVIEIGGTVTGELTEDAPNALYRFSGEEGQSVTITLTSEDFDSYLILQDADGNVIETNDDGAGNLNSLISFTLPSSDDFFIVVETYGHYNGGEPIAGAYELSLVVVEIDVIEFGETVEGELTESALESLYVFRADEGDTVTITLRSDVFDCYLILQDPDGYEVAYNDDGAGNLDSRIGPITLSVAGEYRIIATSLSRTATGPYSLTLEQVDLIPAEIGSPITGELGSGVSQVFYSFEGNSGDVFDFSVESDIDTNITLNDPYNYFVAADEDGGAGVNPELTNVVLNSTGVYTLIVSSSFGDEGTFTLNISRAELPSLSDGPQTISFSSNVTSRSLALEASAGDRVTLTIEADGNASPSVDIYQAGSSLAYASANYVEGFSVTFTVPSDGDVQVNLSEYSYANVRLTVTAEIE